MWKKTQSYTCGVSLFPQLYDHRYETPLISMMTHKRHPREQKTFFFVLFSSLKVVLISAWIGASFSKSLWRFFNFCIRRNRATFVFNLFFLVDLFIINSSGRYWQNDIVVVIFFLPKMVDFLLADVEKFRCSA